MRRTTRYCICAVLYLIRTHIVLISFIVYHFNCAIGSSGHVRPEIIVALILLPPWRLAVTTEKGSLVPLDKLNVL